MKNKRSLCLLLAMLLCIPFTQGCIKSPDASPSIPLQTPMPPVTDSPQPTPDAGDAPFGLDTAAFIKLFAGPQLWLNQVVTPGQSENTAKIGAIDFLLSRLGEQMLYDGLTIPGLAPSSIDKDMGQYAFSAEDALTVALDYCGWSVSQDELIAYCAQMNRYEEAGSIRFMDGAGDSYPQAYMMHYSFEDGNYDATVLSANLDMAFSEQRIGRIVIEANPDSLFGYTVKEYTDGPLVQSIAASSFKEGYDAEQAFDQAPETAWVPQSPTGEWIEFRFTDSVSLAGIVLCSGYEKSAELLSKNNRLKTVRAVFSGGEELSWNLPDITALNEPIALRIPQETATQSVRIFIEEIYPGSSYDDSCLSEVFFVPKSDSPYFPMAAHTIEAAE